MQRSEVASTPAHPNRHVTLQLRGVTRACSNCDKPICALTSIINTLSHQSVAIDTIETTELTQRMLNQAGLGMISDRLGGSQSETLFNPNVCPTCGTAEPWYQVDNDPDSPLILAGNDTVTSETWAGIVQRWSTTPVTVTALGLDRICDSCTQQRTWVVGLRPQRNYRAGDFIQADQPAVVHALRTGLSAAGRPDLADQLLDRPTGQRGAGHNANACGACGVLDDWGTFESVVIEFFHQTPLSLATGPITRAEWDVLVSQRHGVWCE